MFSFYTNQHFTYASNVNQTILSAPVENESGTGSSDATATVLTKAGQYNSVPVGAPAEGSNATNREFLTIGAGNGN